MQTQALWLGPLVVLRPEPAGQVTAEIVGLPEVRATATTREEALRGVRQVVRDWMAAGRLVPLETDGENPWRQYAGWAKNDSEYPQFLEELARQRHELDNPPGQE